LFLLTHPVYVKLRIHNGPISVERRSGVNKLMEGYRSTGKYSQLFGTLRMPNLIYTGCINKKIP